MSGQFRALAMFLIPAACNSDPLVLKRGAWESTLMMQKAEKWNLSGDRRVFQENSGKSVLKRGKLSDDAEYRIHNIEHRIQNQNTVCTKEGGGESSLMMQLKASSPPLHHALHLVSPMCASYMVLTNACILHVHLLHGTGLTKMWPTVLYQKMWLSSQLYKNTHCVINSSCTWLRCHAHTHESTSVRHLHFLRTSGPFRGIQSHSIVPAEEIHSTGYNYTVCPMDIVHAMAW